MANRYVNVAITRQTQAVSQQGFGLALILSTEQAQDYKEYNGIASIGTDFGQDSETYKLASRIFGQEPTPEKIAILGVAYDESTQAPADLIVALDGLGEGEKDFFYLLTTVQGDEEITALGNWINMHDKLYFASTTNQSLAETLASDNTVIMVHDQPETYPEAAWVGYGAPRQPGGFTWTFKTLNGIQPANYDGLTIDAIEEANGNTYIREGGVNITSSGVVTSGEHIDIMQGMYYIKARMIENVFGLLVRNDKIPFTDAGIGMVVAVVEETLKHCANMGIIATDNDGNAVYTISAPLASEVSANDKANRLLPDIKWDGTVAGAIEDVDIFGVLSL